MNENELIDITQHAMWDASSVKMGTCVGSMIDDNFDTFWQSNSWGSHVITANYNRCFDVCLVKIYLSYKMDETYTPKKIFIRVGFDIDAMTTIGYYKLNEPNGWVSLELSPELFIKTALSHKNTTKNCNVNTKSTSQSLGVFASYNHEEVENIKLPFVPKKCFTCSTIQIVIISNLQNGQDSHIRTFLSHMYEEPNIILSSIRSIQLSVYGILNKSLTYSKPGVIINNEINQSSFDMWGPLYFSLIIAFVQSIKVQESESQSLFSFIFGSYWLGAVTATLNINLLSSSPSILLQLSTTCYTTVPFVILSLCKLVIPYNIKLMNYIIAFIGYIWSINITKSSVAREIDYEKYYLILIPFYLQHLILAWCILIS